MKTTILLTYAKTNMNKYAIICTNMQDQICTYTNFKICINTHLYADIYIICLSIHDKMCPGHYMQIKICKNMQRICRNMQYQCRK